MASLRKIYAIALVLAKSQLRSGRSGRGGESFFRNPAVMVVIDAVCFIGCALIGYGVMRAVALIPASGAPDAAALVAQFNTAFGESLVFVPALVPSVVLVAGVLFELSSSSKFASSDSINWLPVSQVEYVTASTLSVAYAYSVVPSVIMGVTLWPSIQLGLGATWIAMLLLSCVALFYGGAIVEILRAAINRVTTAVMGRARRGALVLRLAIAITFIVFMQVIFNPIFLVQLVNRFTSALGVVAFLPVLWASLAVKATLAGDAAQSVVFSAATVGFAVATLFVAVRVRSTYWSPSPSKVTISNREYVPHAGTKSRLSWFGLDPEEAALASKDLKGLTRRRELLQYFSIPFVIAIVFILQLFYNPALNSGSSAQAAAVVGQVPVWFVGGLFGLIISSISFGQEQSSAPLLYSLPLTAKQVLRAKLFVAMLFSMVAVVAVFAVIAAVTRPDPLTLVENLAIALAITAQEVCLGIAFGARFPDFQERPRPRFVDPYGVLLLVIVGLVVMGITALPALLTQTLSSFPGLQSQLRPLFLVSLAFAAAIIGLSYSWASRETKKLFVEFKW